MTRSLQRTDELGRAFAGSQLQIQIYVARRQSQLTAAVAAAMERPDLAGQLQWTAPLEDHRFAEPYDRAFLDALALEGHQEELRAFWPSGGPHWDALAVVGTHGRPALIVLAEGKSYPGEVYGPGCLAEDAESLRLIDSALASTRAWLNVAETASWRGRLYQYANRLAHLYFLNKILGVPAWLVNLCFVGDGTTTPTTESEWRAALPAIKEELGFPPGRIPRVSDVLLPARERTELIG